MVTVAQTHNYPLQLAASTLQLLQHAVTFGLGGEGEAALSKLWTTASLAHEALHITGYGSISLSDTFAKLPSFAHSTFNLLGRIQDNLRAEQDYKLVILDDDPTGTQTCHDINVLTMWDIDLLATEFRSESKGFFILTNSRALPSSEARALVSEILQNVSRAASLTGNKFEVVLRGDSTLRGHFLEEIEAHINTIGSPDAWIVAPFFEHGGRYTIDDVHYVADEGTLVPAANTPFAKDKSFGYRSSNLSQYVLEKAGSRFSKKDVLSVSLEDIRLGGIPAIEQKLLLAPKGGILIVNAVKEEDMLLFCLALSEGTCKSLLISLNGEQADIHTPVRKRHQLRFGYRTGASFVSSCLGIPQRPFILPKEIPVTMVARKTGGLIVVGSYVPKSTKQVQCLIERSGSNLTTLKVEVPALLSELKEYPNIPTMLQHSVTLQEIIKSASKCLQDGRDVLVMTSRDLVTMESTDATSSQPINRLTDLEINTLTANALVYILRHLTVCPRYLLSKGGVTSSDAATAGIGLKRARVLGQAALGVPVWLPQNEEDFKTLDQGGREVRWTQLPLIVFPGNVGQESSLAEVVERWST